MGDLRHIQPDALGCVDFVQTASGRVFSRPDKHDGLLLDKLLETEGEEEEQAEGVDLLAVRTVLDLTDYLYSIL